MSGKEMKLIVKVFGPLLVSAIAYYGLHHTSINQVSLSNQDGKPAITLTITLSLPNRRK